MSALDKVLNQTIPEKKEEVKKPVQAETQTLSVVSEMDRSILERVKSQPKTLEEIDSIVVEKKEDGKHRLSLPEELEQYKKKYAFCWIYKKMQAIDEACQQYHWMLCNRTYFPDVPEYHFSASGIIERGDNVLMFRPAHIDAEFRKQPGIESIGRIQKQFDAHKDDATFYIPEPEYERGADGKLKKVPVVGI